MQLHVMGVRVQGGRGLGARPGHWPELRRQPEQVGGLALAFAQARLHLCLGRAVAVPEHRRPFIELVGCDHAIELGLTDEVIVAPVDLGGARRAGGAGHREARLALANAILEHADGQLTPAAMYAYEQAARADPGEPGPGFFLGVAMIRNGRLPQARELWADMLTKAPADAPWREGLEDRLSRLDSLIAQTANQ